MTSAGSAACRADRLKAWRSAGPEAKQRKKITPERRPAHEHHGHPEQQPGQPVGAAGQQTHPLARRREQQRHQRPGTEVPQGRPAGRPQLRPHGPPRPGPGRPEEQRYHHRRTQQRQPGREQQPLQELLLCLRHVLPAAEHGQQYPRHGEGHPGPHPLHPEHLGILDVPFRAYGEDPARHTAGRTGQLVADQQRHGQPPQAREEQHQQHPGGHLLPPPPQHLTQRRPFVLTQPSPQWRVRLRRVARGPRPAVWRPPGQAGCIDAHGRPCHGPGTRRDPAPVTVPDRTPRAAGARRAGPGTGHEAAPGPCGSGPGAVHTCSCSPLSTGRYAVQRPRPSARRRGPGRARPRAPGVPSPQEQANRAAVHDHRTFGARLASCGKQQTGQTG